MSTVKDGNWLVWKVSDHPSVLPPVQNMETFFLDLATQIQAKSAKEAAKKWAEQTDKDGDFEILEGAEIDVYVAPLQDLWQFECFSLSGFAIPTYFAKKNDTHRRMGIRNGGGMKASVTLESGVSPQMTYVIWAIIVNKKHIKEQTDLYSLTGRNIDERDLLNKKNTEEQNSDMRIVTASGYVIINNHETVVQKSRDSFANGKERQSAWIVKREAS